MRLWYLHEWWWLIACLCFSKGNLPYCRFWEKKVRCPLLFVEYVQIAVQGSEIAEDGGNDSVQIFGSCSLFSNLPIGHTRLKEHAMPGNQIRHWAPCWNWKWKLSDWLALPPVPVDTLWLTFNDCCPFYSNGPGCGENTCCLHTSYLLVWISASRYTWMTSAVDV